MGESRSAAHRERRSTQQRCRDPPQTVEARQRLTPKLTRPFDPVGGILGAGQIRLRHRGPIGITAAVKAMLQPSTQPPCLFELESLGQGVEQQKTSPIRQVRTPEFAQRFRDRREFSLRDGRRTRQMKHYAARPSNEGAKQRIGRSQVVERFRPATSLVRPGPGKPLAVNAQSLAGALNVTRIQQPCNVFRKTGGWLSCHRDALPELIGA